MVTEAGIAIVRDITISTPRCHPGACANTAAPGAQPTGPRLGVRARWPTRWRPRTRRAAGESDDTGPAPPPPRPAPPPPAARSLAVPPAVAAATAPGPVPTSAGPAAARWPSG